ncbi:probable UDP-3-O-acylglucosamine N-acyltransferase 2, mitochondrial isoform X3 [Rosa chinensis]|uniref:probable UDP-3-O-acylglucosamine N-acyltransferase 2, mitochondrial isoform X3 n=1 Tax=Rosa chinensis TaxID=74649 RepID=UPI001AD926C2|nr:probable UDP-3-O-acylglucosamine N-acyltransferase 2, mitochondrial isoform X3 [Rosa chinensis]
MALQLRRLLAAAFGYTPQQVRALSQLGFGACCSSIASPDSSDYGDGTKPQDFQSWPNGGGSFHKSASIDPTAFVEFGAVVHSKSVVGEHVCIGSGAVIGPGVSVGQSTKRFGFMVDEHGNMLKKPQMLNARIGNCVEIGANTCIDRGSWRDTVVGDHSKIDNLVQIGHNVVIGENCMLCGQVGIAGSVTVGDYVTMGGRVAVRDHVSIVSKVRLAATSFVTRDIKEPGDYGGFPVVPIREWRRQVAIHSRTSTKRNSWFPMLCIES